MSIRGYFGIGVYQPKTLANIGTLWRSARNFGASFLFTIGRRYQGQLSDTERSPRHVPLWHFASFDDFIAHQPTGTTIIAVEQAKRAVQLPRLCHPQRAIYLLGAEDDGIPAAVLERCDLVTEIETPRCLNVAVAGSLVMYDRSTKVKVAA